MYNIIGFKQSGRAVDQKTEILKMTFRTFVRLFVCNVRSADCGSTEKDIDKRFFATGLYQCLVVGITLRFM